MINKLKQFFINAGRWIEDKWKHFKRWFIAGIIGASAIAAPLVVQDLTKNEVSLDKIQQKYEQSIEIKAKYKLDGNSLIRNEIKNAELDKYKGEPKDEIKITIGDKNKAEFEPTIELKRWNEVSFKIKPDLTGIDTKDKTLSFESDKIKFSTPKMSFEMYGATDTDEGGYKFIWYLNEKPATNTITFQIETTGLDFFYQPSLTQEYQNGYSGEFQEEIVVSETQVKDLEGNVLIERPENVVGSYAVYHSTKGGMNDVYGKDYKTGQTGMIYEPVLIDMVGNKTRPEKFIINPKTGEYSVTISQDFLDKAIYPIRSNDTFGYTTAGGTESVQASNNDVEGSAFTASGTGTVTKLTVYGDLDTSGTRLVKGVMALNSDLTLIANGVTAPTTVTITSPAWIDLNYSTGPSVTNGTSYILGDIFNLGAPYFDPRYNTGVSNQGVFDNSNNYTTPADLVSVTRSTRKFSIYATYTPSGGGAAAPIPQNIIIE